MSTTSLSAKQDLLSEITTALDRGASSEDLVELIVRRGWQPRPLPNPDSEFIEGRLDSGARVPIEIRHARFSPVG